MHLIVAAALAGPHPMELAPVTAAVSSVRGQELQVCFYEERGAAGLSGNVEAGVDRG